MDMAEIITRTYAFEQSGHRPSLWHTPRLSQLFMGLAPPDPLAEVLNSFLFPNIVPRRDDDLELVETDRGSHPIVLNDSSGFHSDLDVQTII